MDHVKCGVPEGYGVGPAKPQHKRLCDVHALRAHHWNNVFEQGGGGRSANNLFTDKEREMSCNKNKPPVTTHHATIIVQFFAFCFQIFQDLKISKTFLFY